MYLLILLLPLLSFLCGIFLGRWLYWGVCQISTTLVFFSFCLSCVALYKSISTGEVYSLTLAPWLYSDSLQVNWSLYFDGLTCVMLVVITFISSLVHLYSTEYMKLDPHLIRFMSYLSLFTFCMLILVTSNNFLQMFVGWEGVGLASYLLINFWFTRVQANKSAIKAMLINRVGDFFLLLGIFTIFCVYNTLNYDAFFCLIPLSLDFKLIFAGYNMPVLDLICCFILFGAMGKSAQLGLHTWLPDAMEGPTPVSALIHAATMVTAGIFLISRCSYLFEFSTFSLMLLSLVGSCTAFFAATTGLFQNDMKKIIAYSTCSQLGYMMFSCGLSSYDVSMFHLTNHAFFKALLFLGAGSVIHAVGDEQDIRKLGGLKNLLPLSFMAFLVGSFALTGFPFLSGFFSKDIILEVSISSYSFKGHFSFFFGLLSVFLTAFYSTRLLFLTFLINPNGIKNVYLQAHESSWRITIPLVLLAFLSIFSGFLFKDFFIGLGTNFWGSSIFVLPYNYYCSDIEFLDIFIKIMPLIFSMLGIFSGFFLYRFYTFELFKVKNSSKSLLIFFFFSKKMVF